MNGYKLCLRPIGGRGGDRNPANSVYLHTAWSEELGRLGGRKAKDWFNNPSAGISIRPNDDAELTKADDFIRCAWGLPSRSKVEATDRKANDISEPPERIESVVNRIVRDTALSQWVKRQHKQTCQLCQKPVHLPDGTAYSEGHHIHPLGNPHNGPDVRENILCLCPNCHALCDLGAIRLVIVDLHQVEGHFVGQEFIDYHNQKIHAVHWGRPTRPGDAS